jgi:hypothetical protein
VTAGQAPLGPASGRAVTVAGAPCSRRSQLASAYTLLRAESPCSAGVIVGYQSSRTAPFYAGSRAHDKGRSRA